MPDPSSNENWVLGVTLGLLGSVAINTGNNIQSLGLKALRDKEGGSSRVLARTVPVDEKGNSTETELEHKEQGQCSSTVWIFGTVVFVSGSLLNFASYAFAAQSMLASLESIQFVTNLIFGKFMLKAHVTRRMIIGTVLTVVGTIVAVQFSSKTTLTLTTAEMIQLYRNPAYIIYLLFSLVMIALLNFIYNQCKKRKRERRPLPHTDIVMPVCYSILSALVGTQSVVQAKVLAELLSVQSSATENVFKSSFVYWTMVVWLLTAIVWLSRLNNALSKFDPLFIIPLLQCSFIFFAVVSGGIFFREFDEFSKRQGVGFAFGVLVMFSGLSLLVPKQNYGINKVNGEQSEDAMQEVGNGMDASLALRDDCTTIQDLESIALPSLSENHSSVVSTTHEQSTQSPHLESLITIKRQSRQSIAQAAFEAVKDVIIESANRSSILLTPPTGIAYQHWCSEDKEKKILQRNNKLKRLQVLLEESKDDPVRIVSPETIRLLADLEIDIKGSRKGNLDFNSPTAFRDEISRQLSAVQARSLTSKRLVFDAKFID